MTSDEVEVTQQHPHRPSLHRIPVPGTVVLAVVLGLLLALLPSGLSFASAQNVDAQLAQARRDLSAVRAELGPLDAELEQARAELDDVAASLARATADLRVAEGQLALADEALGDANARAEVAQANLDVAVDLLQRAEDDLEQEEDVFVDQIIAFHKYGAAGRGQLVLRVFENATSPIDVATSLYRLGAVLDYQDHVVERVDQLRNDREVLRGDAEETRVLADTEQETAEQTRAFRENFAEQAQTLTATVAAEEAAQRIILNRLEGERRTQVTRLQALEALVKKLEDEQRRQQLAAAGGGAILCPQNPAWFQNDWGYPRSGGRTHKGTDVFSDVGTPVRAVANGSIRRLDHTNTYRPGSNSGDLGGISISIWTSGNEYWYFAHLQRLADGLREGDAVSAGQVIGWVGNTGNAYSTPSHTHIGRYVNGSAVNPFPLLNAACNG